MKTSKHSGVVEQKGRKGTRYFTKNLVPGKQVYGERLRRTPQGELREWSSKRSKLGAGLVKGLRDLGCNAGSYVLYLGCASGTTVSHISDIVGKKGLIFAVDISPHTMRQLVFLAKERKNIAPILCDANHSEELGKKIVGVDVLYQDVSQRHQVMIFLKSLQFLKSGGKAILSVKARSIDVTKKPQKIFDAVRKELETQVKVEQALSLHPLEKDHMLFLCVKK